MRSIHNHNHKEKPCSRRRCRCCLTLHEAGDRTPGSRSWTIRPSQGQPPSKNSATLALKAVDATRPPNGSSFLPAQTNTRCKRRRGERARPWSSETERPAGSTERYAQPMSSSTVDGQLRSCPERLHRTSCFGIDSRGAVAQPGRGYMSTRLQRMTFSARDTVERVSVRSGPRRFSHCSSYSSYSASSPRAQLQPHRLLARFRSNASRWFSLRGIACLGTAPSGGLPTCRTLSGRLAVAWSEMRYPTSRGSWQPSTPGFGGSRRPSAILLVPDRTTANPSQQVLRSALILPRYRTPPGSAGTTFARFSPRHHPCINRGECSRAATQCGTPAQRTRAHVGTRTHTAPPAPPCQIRCCCLPARRPIMSNNRTNVSLSSVRLLANSGRSPPRRGPAPCARPSWLVPLPGAQQLLRREPAQRGHRNQDKVQEPFENLSRGGRGGGSLLRQSVEAVRSGAQEDLAWSCARRPAAPGRSAAPPWGSASCATAGGRSRPRSTAPAQRRVGTLTTLTTDLFR